MFWDFLILQVEGVVIGDGDDERKGGLVNLRGLGLREGDGD